jgi:hypothetical protein
MKTRSSTLAAAGLLLCMCVRGAGAAPIDEAAILKAVEAVVADQKTMVTCVALDPEMYKMVLEYWSLEVETGTKALMDLEPSAQLAARFVEAVLPERILPDKNMLLSQASALCAGGRGQQLIERWASLDLRLAKAIKNPSGSGPR